MTLINILPCIYLVVYVKVRALKLRVDQLYSFNECFEIAKNLLQCTKITKCNLDCYYEQFTSRLSARYAYNFDTCVEKAKKNCSSA